MENEEIIKRYCGNTIMAVELTDRQLIVHFAGEVGFAITNQTGGMYTLDELHELVGQTLESIKVDYGLLPSDDDTLIEVFHMKVFVEEDDQLLINVTNEGAGWDGGFDLVVSEVR